MTAFARKDDRTTGTCYHPSHLEPISIGGKITGSAAKTVIENKLAARVGDEVTSDCGHKGKIILASGNILAEGKRLARAGDPFSGDYVGTIVGSASRSGTDNGISGDGPE
jgi:uncharacterized Zn-binding protein involved in type VI secretion